MITLDGVMAITLVVALGLGTLAGAGHLGPALFVMIPLVVVALLALLWCLLWMA